MGVALAATARTRRERMAEKRMVVENEGVGRVKEECGIYRRCQEWGHLCSTFILSGASAGVKVEAAATSQKELHRFSMEMQMNDQSSK
jgi:hypothetical protein